MAQDIRNTLSGTCLASETASLLSQRLKCGLFRETSTQRQCHIADLDPCSLSNGPDPSVRQTPLCDTDASRRVDQPYITISPPTMSQNASKEAKIILAIDSIEKG